MKKLILSLIVFLPTSSCRFAYLEKNNSVKAAHDKQLEI